MTALELYRFIEEDDLEVDWRGEELVAWVPYFILDEFTEMIKDYIDLDAGVDVTLQSECVALDICDICGYYGIRPEDIKEK